MSQNDDGQLYARVGSGVKSDLADIANVKETSISEETKLAVKKHINEHRGERVQPVHISRMSVWDQFTVIMYGMAGLSAVFTLAGFDMITYTIGFAAMGLIGMVMEQRADRYFQFDEQEVRGV